MRTASTELRLRCFAERRRDGRWYAHCIDLTLDAEAATYREAVEKLDAAIGGYLDWAVREQRLSLRAVYRRSPREFRLRYVRAWLRETTRSTWAALRRRAPPANAPHEAFSRRPALPSAA